MSITVEQRDKILQLLKKKYPDWQGFSHHAFRRNETNAKRSTAKKAASWMSESTLAQLLVTRKTDQFIEQLVQFGQFANLLRPPTSDTENGDLEILYVRTLDKPGFCAQIYHLLHSTEPIYDRFHRYLSYVEDHELPNTWTFPTYFLQFCYPATELFIEPRSSTWLLKFFGITSTLGKPSAQKYRTLKDLAFQIKEAFSEFRPLDLIDIQSLIQVCSSASEPAEVQRPDRHDARGREATVEAPSTIEVEEHKYDYAAASPREEELFWAEEAPDEYDEDSDPTMLTITEISDESQDELDVIGFSGAEAPLPPALDPPNGGSPDHDDSLQSLYVSFMNKYMSTPAGVARAAAYAKAREQAEQNFSQLIAEHELGENVTDRVFQLLLPHADTPENQRRGVWIHPVSARTQSLAEALDEKYPGNRQIKSQIAEVLLEFIRHCVYKSNALKKSSEALEKLAGLSLIDLFTITPILHALKPNQYILLHDTSISAVNSFAGTDFSSTLQQLPDLNATAIQIIQTLRSDRSTARMSSVQDADLFDIFCHWLFENANSDMPPPELPSETPPQETTRPQDPIGQDYTGKDSAFRPPAAYTTNGILQEAATSLSECARLTYLPVDTLIDWQKTLFRKGQLIFRGPAGTGKTFIAQHFSSAIAGASDAMVQLVQFHPGLTHRDFWGDDTATGLFKQFCLEAARRSGPCVFIADDIDRATPRDVFGDLLYKLEYRTHAPVTYASPADGNPQPAYIPKNVFLVGTMCSADPAGVMDDAVFRRRFAFIDIRPDYTLLKTFHASTSFDAGPLIRTLREVNEAIEREQHKVGITYFLRHDLEDHLESIWTHEIEPAIEVGLSEDRHRIESFRWTGVKQQLRR